MRTMKLRTQRGTWGERGTSFFLARLGG
jgi:hypothetical protein